MAKTLVIKNANFAANALDTVDFSSIPCTGLSISPSTLEINSMTGSYTITPTVTPADTTDAMTWVSSDTDVVTVLDGALTVVGLGTATITATCGQFTDTCEVTVDDVVADPVTWLLGSCAPDTNITASFTVNAKQFTAIGDYIDGGGNTTTLILNDMSDSPAYHKELHPISIPKGATKVTFTAESLPNTSFATIGFYDGAKAGSSSYPAMLKGLSRVYNSIPTSPASIEVSIPETAIYLTVAVGDKTEHTYADDINALAETYGITITFS